MPVRPARKTRSEASSWSSCQLNGPLRGNTPTPFCSEYAQGLRLSLPCIVQVCCAYLACLGCPQEPTVVLKRLPASLQYSGLGHPAWTL